MVYEVPNLKYFKDNISQYSQYSTILPNAPQFSLMPKMPRNAPKSSQVLPNDPEWSQTRGWAVQKTDSTKYQQKYQQKVGLLLTAASAVSAFQKRIAKVNSQPSAVFLLQKAESEL